MADRARSIPAHRAVRVLLIDHDPDDARVLSEAIGTGAFADLVIAADASEALAVLRQSGPFAEAPRPDVILLDPNVRGTRQPGLLAELRGDPNLRGIPVIVLAEPVRDGEGRVADRDSSLPQAGGAPPAGQIARLVEVVRAINEISARPGTPRRRPRPPRNTVRGLLVSAAPARIDALRAALRNTPRSELVVRLDGVAAGDDAMSRIGTGGIDVAILDLTPEGGGGVSTLFALHEQAPDLPVVALVDAADPAVPLRAIAAGAQDYLAVDELHGGVIARVLRFAIERRRLEGALNDSERMAALGRLVSGVAHELNNPISAILHFAEGMLDDERSDDDVEALGIVRGEALRARGIIHNLLALSRARAHDAGVVDVRERLAWAVRVLTAQVTLGGAHLELDAHGELGTIEIDWSAIEQVLINLVINAAHAAGRGGRVRVGARRDATQLEITVDDDGPGIPPHIMTRLFEPFFTTKAAGEGTGLGLSVSLRIMHQQGGVLRAENRRAPSGEVEGARFVMRIPIRPAAATPFLSTDHDGSRAPAGPSHSAERAMLSTKDSGNEDPSRSHPPQTGANAAGPGTSGSPKQRAPRALIIDDEPSVRLALRRLFTRSGWEVEEAEEGVTGLRLALQADPADDRRYDLVVSDLRMPGLSGIELYDAIAEERPALLARLVFTTGDVASEEAAAFVARASCTVLQKPFELSALKALMSRALGDA
jgi:signal transduction histidine kinase